MCADAELAKSLAADCLDLLCVWCGRRSSEVSSLLESKLLDRFNSSVLPCNTQLFLSSHSSSPPALWIITLVLMNFSSFSVALLSFHQQLNPLLCCQTCDEATRLSSKSTGEDLKPLTPDGVSDFREARRIPSKKKVPDPRKANIEISRRCDVDFEWGPEMRHATIK